MYLIINNNISPYSKTFHSPHTYRKCKHLVQTFDVKCSLAVHIIITSSLICTSLAGCAIYRYTHDDNDEDEVTMQGMDYFNQTSIIYPSTITTTSVIFYSFTHNSPLLIHENKQEHFIITDRGRIASPVTIVWY
jgi:hypothetical protein